MLKIYKTICCDLIFIGMNHSPEENGICRNCNGQFRYELYKLEIKDDKKV